MTAGHITIEPYVSSLKCTFYSSFMSLHVKRRAQRRESIYQNLQATAPLEFMRRTIATATLQPCPDRRSTSTDQVRGALKGKVVPDVLSAAPRC